jgi:hypothetical protein
MSPHCLQAVARPLAQALVLTSFVCAHVRSRLTQSLQIALVQPAQSSATSTDSCARKCTACQQTQLHTVRSIRQHACESHNSSIITSSISVRFVKALVTPMLIFTTTTATVADTAITTTGAGVPVLSVLSGH